MSTEDTHVTERDHKSTCQEQEPITKRQLERCVNGVGRITLTFSNLHVVQLGESNELAYDVEPCHNHRCNKKKQLKYSVTKEDEKLKENSTPDEAADVPEIDSAISTEAFNNAEAGLPTLSAKDGCKAREEFQQERIKDVTVEYGIPLIRKQGSITGNGCETVMKHLEKLQDNGQFEAHEKFACAILESSSTKEDPDMRATLMIERGMAFYYANDLQKCKHHFNVAIRMGDSLVNRSLLEGRALFLKSAAYRREKKLNKALQCLQRAELLLFHHDSGEDKGELYYNYGSFWLDMYSIKSANNQGRKIFREKAKNCFENAIEHGSGDERLRVQLKKKRYYNLRIAALYIDCGSKAARKAHQVHIEDVEEAKKRLDFVEYQLADDMPRGTKVELLKTRSDQYYRQGNVRLARQAAEEGLEIAKKLETNSSIGSLRERLEELQAIEDARPQYIESVIWRVSDSGWSGDCSNSDD